VANRQDDIQELRDRYALLLRASQEGNPDTLRVGLASSSGGAWSEENLLEQLVQRPGCMPGLFQGDLPLLPRADS